MRAGLKVSEYGIEQRRVGRGVELRRGGRGVRAPGPAVDPAGAARGPRRARGRPGGQAARARRGRRHPRRPAHAHRLERRQGDARADGRRGARPRLRVPERHRPLARGRVRDGARRRPPARPDRARARAGGDARAGLHAARRAPRWTSSATARSTTPTSCSRSSMSWWRACTPSHRLSAADQTKRVCAALENPHVAHPRPPHRAADRPAPAEPARHRGGGGEGGRDGHGARGELPAPPARPERHPRAPGRRGGRPARDRHRRPLGGGARLPAVRRHERPPGLDRAGDRGQHAARGRSCARC